MSGVLITVFVASIFGSLHCVGMCGSFVAFYTADHRGPAAGASESAAQAAADWAAHLAYNFGRLAVYAVLGAVAGSAGAALNLAGEGRGISQIAAVVCGGLIVVWGSMLLMQAAGARWAKWPVPYAVNRLLGAILTRLRRASPPVRAAALGVSSALLPCGWLYGFVVAAAGTGDVARGALVMGAFWLGTVPAMLGLGLGVHRLARAMGPRLGLLMPMMMVLMGLFTIAHRGFMGLATTSGGLGS